MAVVNKFALRLLLVDRYYLVDYPGNFASDGFIKSVANHDQKHQFGFL